MRLKIALRNLYISQAFILLFLLFAYFVWFPHSFSRLGGFNKTALMLIFVDLVLGPLLVFIVYKKDKKHLTFDINVLLAIQLAAFVFGAYSLYLKHPAYAVFTGDKFTLTNVSHLYPQPSWTEQLKTTFFSSPRLVIAKMPKAGAERMALMLDVDLFGAPDINRRPKYFVPFTHDSKDRNGKSVLEKSLDPDMLFTSGKAWQKLAQFLKHHGGHVRDYVFIPLSGNNKQNVIFVLNKQNARPVGIIDATPWKLANK